MPARDATVHTTFCFDDARNTAAKLRWRKYAPNLTRDIEWGGPHQAGFASVRPGDVLLAPVGWLRHWVPPILEPNVTRTAVVFNMVCI